MDLYSIKTIKEILREHNTAPKDRLGQNFLLEKRVAVKMLKAAELSQKDTVLEIGPGIGTLTRELALHLLKKGEGLAQNANKVIAVEKDPAMVEILKETVKDLPNIEIVQANILSLPKARWGKLALGKDNGQMSNVLVPTKELLGRDKEYRVVANLPYSIASPVIRKFLEFETVEDNPQHSQQPGLMVLMVQKEVAQRICANPPDMNLLAVSVQFYGKPKIVSFVSKGAFWPRPKVDSAILKITPKKTAANSNDRAFTQQFFKVVRAGFKQPRKQLLNNLSQGLNLSKHEVKTWLSQANIQPTQRAETLSMQNWINLAQKLS